MCVGSHCCLADLATPWLPTQVPPAADTLVAVGASVRTRAETVLPVVAAKLHLSVGDARTEALLMRAIKVCTGGGGRGRGRAATRPSRRFARKAMNGLTGVGTRDQTDERGAGYQGQVLGTHKQLVTLAQTEYDVRVSAGVPSLHTLRMTLDTAAPEPNVASGPSSSVPGASAAGTPQTSRPPSPPPALTAPGPAGPSSAPLIAPTNVA